MTKAEKFNLYADTLYGMCRKAQDTVPEANVCFECKAFSSEKSGTYRTICVGITTTEGSRKYYYVCEALRDMEENFVSVKAVLNNLLLNDPCPYCEKGGRKLMAVEKESSVDFIPETVEEEYAMLAGRLKAVEAYLDASDYDYIDKNVLAAMLGI